MGLRFKVRHGGGHVWRCTAVDVVVMICIHTLAVVVCDTVAELAEPVLSPDTRQNINYGLFCFFAGEVGAVHAGTS